MRTPGDPSWQRPTEPPTIVAAAPTVALRLRQDDPRDDAPFKRRKVWPGYGHGGGSPVHGWDDRSTTKGQGRAVSVSSARNGSDLPRRPIPFQPRSFSVSNPPVASTSSVQMNRLPTRPPQPLNTPHRPPSQQNPSRLSGGPYALSQRRSHRDETSTEPRSHRPPTQSTSRANSPRPPLAPALERAAPLFNAPSQSPAPSQSSQTKPTKCAPPYMVENSLEQGKAGAPPVLFDELGSIITLAGFGTRGHVVSCTYNLPLYCVGAGTSTLVQSARQNLKKVVDKALADSGWVASPGGGELEVVKGGTMFRLFLTRSPAPCAPSLPPPTRLPAPMSPPPAPIVSRPVPARPVAALAIPARPTPRRTLTPPLRDRPGVGKGDKVVPLVRQERATEVDTQVDELEERILVPPSCRGPSNTRALKAFTIAALKTAFSRGRVVLANRLIGNELVLSYVLDTASQMDTAELPDVKPVLPAAPVPRQIASVPQIVRTPVLFPRGVSVSYADSPLTKQSAEIFLLEYFSRFDNSRSSLQDFYTPTASLSIVYVAAVPDRLTASTSRAIPFSSKYANASNGISITPTPIMNAIRRLPAGQHHISRLVYDAFAMPSLRARASSQPDIFLTVHGEFEEFQAMPQATRSFSRTFLLVPKRVLDTSGAGCPINYLVQADTIAYRHYLPLPQTIPVGANSRASAATSHRRSPSSETDVVILDVVPAPPRARKPAALPRPIVRPQHNSGVITRSRSVSPDRSSPADTSASRNRRAERETTVFNEYATPSGSSGSGKAVETWQQTMARQLKALEDKINAGPPVEKPSAVQAAAPRAAAPLTPPADDDVDELDSGDEGRAHQGPTSADKGVKSKAARKLYMKSTVSYPHSHGGKTNKMRLLFDVDADRYLGVSNNGDILEWSKRLPSSLRTLKTAPPSADRVDTAGFVGDALLIGYLGPPKESPACQVGIFASDRGQPATFKPFTVFPHYSCGVTALSPIGTGAIKFATAGSDKSLFIWSNVKTAETRLSCEARTTRINTRHTSTISSLCWLESERWLMSVGSDKKLFGFDLKSDQAAFAAVPTGGLLTQVQQIDDRPHTILTATAAQSNQFSVIDVRLKPADLVTMSFGFQLPAHASGTKVGVSRPLGRFVRGDFLDSNTFVHPDGTSGIVVFDLRYNRARVPQRLPSAGRSKVYQVLFETPSKMALLEQDNVTVVYL